MCPNTSGPHPLPAAKMASSFHPVATHQPQCRAAGWHWRAGAPAQGAAVRQAYLGKPRFEPAGEKKKGGGGTKPRREEIPLAFTQPSLTLTVYNPVWKGKWQMRGAVFALTPLQPPAFMPRQPAALSGLGGSAWLCLPAPRHLPRRGGRRHAPDPAGNRAISHAASRHRRKRPVGKGTYPDAPTAVSVSAGPAGWPGRGERARGSRWRCVPSRQRSLSSGRPSSLPHAPGKAAARPPVLTARAAAACRPICLPRRAGSSALPRPPPQHRRHPRPPRQRWGPGRRGPSSAAPAASAPGCSPRAKALPVLRLPPRVSTAPGSLARPPHADLRSAPPRCQRLPPPAPGSPARGRSASFPCPPPAAGGSRARAEAPPPAPPLARPPQQHGRLQTQRGVAAAAGPGARPAAPPPPPGSAPHHRGGSR